MPRTVHRPVACLLGTIVCTTALALPAAAQTTFEPLLPGQPGALDEGQRAATLEIEIDGVTLTAQTTGVGGEFVAGSSGGGINTAGIEGSPEANRGAFWKRAGRFACNQWESYTLTVDQAGTLVSLSILKLNTDKPGTLKLTNDASGESVSVELVAGEEAETEAEVALAVGAGDTVTVEHEGVASYRLKAIVFEAGDGAGEAAGDEPG